MYGFYSYWGYIWTFMACAVYMGNVVCKWAATQKSHFGTCTPTEDSYQPAHSRSLIKSFPGRILDSQGCKASSCGQRRLKPGCADAQAGMSLRWADISEGTFTHATAQMIFEHPMTLTSLKVLYWIFRQEKKSVNVPCKRLIPPLWMHS